MFVKVIIAQVNDLGNQLNQRGLTLFCRHQDAYNPYMPADYRLTKGDSSLLCHILIIFSTFL
jgi:hypothetical protein